MENLKKAAADRHVLNVICKLTTDELQYLHEIAQQHQQTAEQVVEDIKRYKVK